MDNTFFCKIFFNQRNRYILNLREIFTQNLEIDFLEIVIQFIDGAGSCDYLPAELDYHYRSIVVHVISIHTGLFYRSASIEYSRHFLIQLNYYRIS